VNAKNAVFYSGFWLLSPEFCLFRPFFPEKYKKNLLFLTIFFDFVINIFPFSNASDNRKYDFLFFVL